MGRTVNYIRNACTKSGSLRFSVFRLLTDFVCLYTYEFWLISLCKIARSSVILLLPLFIGYFLSFFLQVWPAVLLCRRTPTYYGRIVVKILYTPAPIIKIVLYLKMCVSTSACKDVFICTLNVQKCIWTNRCARSKPFLTRTEELSAVEVKFMSGFGKTTIFNGLLDNRPNFFCWASDYLIWSNFWSPE